MGQTLQAVYLFGPRGTISNCRHCLFRVNRVISYCYRSITADRTTLKSFDRLLVFLTGRLLGSHCSLFLFYFLLTGKPSTLFGRSRTVCYTLPRDFPPLAMMFQKPGSAVTNCEPPAAVKLLATLKSRLSFHLPCSQSVLCPTVVVVTSLDSGVLGVSLDPFMDPLSKCVSNVGPFGYIIKFMTALTVAFIGCTVGVFFVCSYLAVTHFIWISWSPSLVVL